MVALTSCWTTTAPPQRRMKKRVIWSSTIPAASTRRRAKRARKARRRRTKRKSGVTAANVWRRTQPLMLKISMGKVFFMPSLSLICPVANGSSDGGLYAGGRSGSHSDKKRKKEEKARLKAQKVDYKTYQCTVKQNPFHSNSFLPSYVALWITGQEEGSYSVSDLLQRVQVEHPGGAARSRSVHARAIVNKLADFFFSYLESDWVCKTVRK